MRTLLVAVTGKAKVAVDRARYNWGRLIGNEGIGNKSVLNVRPRKLLEIRGARDLRVRTTARDSENVISGERHDDRVATAEPWCLCIPNIVLQNNWYRDWNCAWLNPFTARFVYRDPCESFPAFFKLIFLACFYSVSVHVCVKCFWHMF